MSRAIGLYALALLAGAFSCSSDSEGDGDGAAGSGGASSASSAATTGAGGDDDPTPDESCVQPGDTGNDKGIGEYCTPTGGECKGFPEAPLCLASVGQQQWFCTQIGCTETSDCGADAGCLITGDGSACVPCRCADTSPQCGGTGGSGGMSSSGGTGGEGGSGGG